MIAEFADWLKHTIPGIIILGALGSIAALLSMKLLRYLAILGHRLFTKVLPQQTAHIKKWVMKKLFKIAYNIGYEAGYMGVGKNANITIAYFAFHVSRAVGWLMLLVIFSIFAVMALASQGTHILTLGAYLLLVVAFITAWRAFSHLLAITLSYRQMNYMVKNDTNSQTQKNDRGSFESET